MDETLTDSTTPGQSKPGSNDNQGLIHILKSSKNWASRQMLFRIILRKHPFWGVSLSKGLGQHILSPTDLVFDWWLWQNQT